jgi:hypothetical protein
MKPSESGSVITLRLLIVSVVGSLIACQMARAAEVFALVGLSNGSFEKLDITTGQPTAIGNSGSAFAGLAWSANETTLYGIVGFGGPSTLVQINPATGASTTIGANGASIYAVTSLANGQIYGVDVSDNLYKINSQTGAATLVGATGLPSLSSFQNSLASDGTTLYYTLGFGGTDTLYTLDTNTGVASTVGSTGASGIIGSAFAGPTFSSGELYGFTTGGQTDVIDVNTGAATSLNSNGLTNIFGGVGVVTDSSVGPPPPPTSAVPLPPAVWSGAVSLCLLVGVWQVVKLRRRAADAAE